MNVFKKIVCLFLAMLLTFSMVPLTVFAQDSTTAEKPVTEVNGDVYSIRNDYVKYSINAKTGGFSIETLDGNPQKQFDNNIPLLYREDTARSSGTSFTTVRIGGRDYIFGRDYSGYGTAYQSTASAAFAVGEDGRYLTVSWTILGYEVVQQIALSAEEDMDLTGNVGILYSVKNTNADREDKVGIRVLLDAALDSTVDAPYLLCDTDGIPLKTEVEYVGDAVPAQIRGLDAISKPSKMLYAFTNPMGNTDTRADRVIIGHWRNLANTRYAYTPDPYCDFTNYSNQHMTPDAAMAFYWDEAVLAAGAVREAELLYGVGNFASTVIEDSIGLGMVINNKIRLNEDGDGYVDDGKFSVTVNLDNSVDGARKLKDAILTLSYDDGITAQGVTTYALSELEAGAAPIVYEFELAAEVQDSVCGLDIGVTLSADVENEDGTLEFITVNAQKTVIVPGAAGKPKITVTSAAPRTLYTGGTKTLTLVGQLKPLYAINATDGWELKLYHTTTDHTVTVRHSDVAFLNDAHTMLSVSTDEELVVGEYEIGFTFTDEQLVQGLGFSEIRFDKTFRVSNDPVYKTRSFGLVALIRTDAKYTYVPFADQQEYDNFLNGRTFSGAPYDFGQDDPTTGGYFNMCGEPFVPFEPDDAENGKKRDSEVILIMRGPFHEILDENNKFSHYQASPADGDIRINEILSYTGSKPMALKWSGGESAVFTVEGNGKLQVVSSIDVWKGKWSFQVNDGTVTSLDSGRSDANELSLTLGGVGYMVQSIGGFLIDMKYGVMGSSRRKGTERSDMYSISFGGSLSIPIAIPTPSKKEQADNSIKNDGGALDEDYSDAFGLLFADDDQQFVPAEEEKETFRKDTNLDDSALAVAIDSILYGQDDDDDIGFIGIDTTVSLGLPKDLLGKLIQNAPGVRASLTINTIDHFYMLEAGLDIKAIQCEGVLSFAMTDVMGTDVVLPDSIQFYIRDGLKIPLAPPVLFISGLGGGLDGIADTIGGEFDVLPPLTLLLFMRLDLVEVLMGDFSASLALTGISLDGELSVNVGGLVKDKKPADGTDQGGNQGGNNGNTGNNQGSTGNNQGNTGNNQGNTGNNQGNTGNNQGSTGNNQGNNQGNTGNNQGGSGSTHINGAKTSELNPANVTKFATSVIDTLLSPVSIKFGASARWIDPIRFTAYGNVTVIGGLLSGGISITITDNSFNGYAYLSLQIPDDVPIVGGYELAGVEAAISDKFIGANLKVIGIKIGFIYYWTGDFNFGTGINIRSARTKIEYPEYSTGALYGTNLTKISLQQPMKRFAARTVTPAFTLPASAVNGQSLVIEIPYTWEQIPDVQSITVTNPAMQTVTLTAASANGEGSFLVQHTEAGSVMYVSVTKPDLIRAGAWSVTVNETAVGLTLGEIAVYGVADIPALQTLTVDTAVRTDNTSRDLSIGWKLDGISDGTGTIDLYLTKDKTVLEQLKKDNTESHDLIGIGNVKLSEMEDGTADITIPEAMESGEYYVVAMLTQDIGGMSTAISNTSFTFVNPLLPKAVDAVCAIYAGDGDLYVQIDDADDPDYNYYLVEIYDENGNAVPNTMEQFALGETVHVGGEANLNPGERYTVGVMTLREDNLNDKFFYGTDVVRSAPIVMPAVDKPVLISVETNISDNSTTDDFIEITYTFDRPVWMYTEVNHITMYAVEDLENGEKNYFKKSWTFKTDLPDGDYTVDFTAYGQNKDTLTAKEAGAALGFTVDATAPALSLTQTSADALTDPSDGKRVHIASSVVFADANGDYVIEGLTEKTASLTANGTSVEVRGDGTFTCHGNLGGEASVEILLTAVDPAGNSTSLAVTVEAGVSSIVEDVEIRCNGRPITVNADGERVIDLSVGMTAELTLVGKTADGKTVVIEDPVWEILSDRHGIAFDNGALTAIAEADTAVKASILMGTAVNSEGSRTTLRFEDYVILRIGEGNKQQLADAIAAAEENLSESQFSAPTAAIEAFRQAIDAAKAVYDNTEATDSMVSDAVLALQAAAEAFDAVKVVDRSTLEAAIAAAEQNIAETGNATQREIETYRAAITAAQTVLGTQGLAQDEIAAAVETLARATAVFNTAKNRTPYLPSTLYAIHVKESAHGTVSVSQNIVYEGTSLTITSTPDRGFSVESVKVNGRDFGAYETITVAGVYSNLTVEVTFKLTWESPFIDVTPDDWFYPYVAWAALNNITQGTSENTFSPEIPLTRAMLVTFLWRAEGCPTPEGARDTAKFADVAEGMFYTEAVAWAAENGIVCGYPDGNFGPDDIITREQIAVILQRTASYMEYSYPTNKDTSPDTFADASEISAYAVDSMRWAIESGMIIGDGEGCLDPLGDASRAESVTILSRFYESVR